MRLVRLMLDSEPILPRVHRFIHSHFVPRDVDVTFNFGFLLPCQPIRLGRNHHTHRLAVAPQTIQVWTGQDEVSDPPGIVPISLFAHPSAMISLPDLLQDALTLLNGHNITVRCNDNTLILAFLGRSGRRRTRSLPKSVALIFLLLLLLSLLGLLFFFLPLPILFTLFELFHPLGRPFWCL